MIPAGFPHAMSVNIHAATSPLTHGVGRRMNDSRPVVTAHTLSPRVTFGLVALGVEQD